MADVIRVFVVDDHLVVRQGLRLILDSDPAFAWVGDAPDGPTFLERLEEVDPDVVLMDVRMPGMDGLEALEAARRRRPDLAVVILTTFDEDDQVVRAVKAGARGYLLKDADRATLLETVRAAARGDVLLRSGDLEKAMAVDDRPAGPSGRRLTPREREVCDALVAGASNKRIAKRLGIRERTVKAHLTSIYEKLGVSGRTEAVAKVLRERR